MRIDKFLKVSRIIKRRSVSKDIVSFGQVKINNRVAKPSTSIKIGDIVELSLGSKIITIEIMSIDVTGSDGKTTTTTLIYKIISEKDIIPPMQS